MSREEFDDFFKEIDEDRIEEDPTDLNDGDLIFSSFFEDCTVKPEENSKKETKKSKSEPFVADDEFAPPPPVADEDEENVRKTEKKTNPVVKTVIIEHKNQEEKKVQQAKKTEEETKKKTSAKTEKISVADKIGGIADKFYAVTKQKKDELTEKKSEKVKKASKIEKIVETEATEIPVNLEERKKNTLKNWLVTIIWVSGVILSSILIASFALSSLNDLVGFYKSSYEAEVVIPEGAGLGEIAGILKDKGIIDEPFAFEVYARVKHMQNRLYAGTYTLNSNLGYDQIFQTLRSKEYDIETVKITFYEGMKATEIAKKLEENGVCGYDEFMNAVDNEEFDYEFADMMGKNDYIYHKWEGYLFPDTYEFYLDMKPRSVLAKFIDNFNKKFVSSYYARMQEMDLTLGETITLASVIQSEAAFKEDMEYVSSVFHNRLVPGSGFGYLQSDVTYFYYQQEIEPNVSDQTLSDKYHTSYDTYYKEGIPVGPICNPGIEAIEAALYPANTHYYYFVADSEGNFAFAKTLAEHQVNMAKAGLY